VEPGFLAPVDERPGVEVVPVGVEDVVPVVEVEPDVVVEGGAHDSDTEATPTLTGSGIADTGVPGGTLTVNDSVCPVTVFTVTTQESAWALDSGMAATAHRAAATPTSLIHSRALTCVCLPPACNLGRDRGGT
jgi:hypothetical protein